MSILRKKPLDASGQPIIDEQLYVPVVPYATVDHKVYAGGVELRGDNPAVQAVAVRWVRADAGSVAKGAALAAHRARGVAQQSDAPPDPTAPRVLGPIPPERRRRALRNYVDKSGTVVTEGSIWDSRDEFVQGNPSWFGPDEAA